MRNCWRRRWFGKRTGLIRYRGIGFGRGWGVWRNGDLVGHLQEKIRIFYTGHIPWIKTGELENNFIYDTIEKITDDAIKKSSAKLFPINTIVIAMYAATIGKVGIMGVESSTNQACACGIYSEALNYMFLFYFALSQKENFIKVGKGGAQPNISQEIIKTHAFPLPPLAEQQRIVDRIESLFDQLDQAKDLIQDALDSFKTRKAAILHQAFTGQLTKKWREAKILDTPEGIYNNIVRDRIAIGAVSKDVSQYLNDICLNEVVDKNNWLCLKAMVLCENITCGGTPTGFISEKGDIPFLKVYNIVNNQIDFNYRPQFIDNNTNLGKLKSSILRPRDIVMNIVGLPLRKIAFIPEDYPEWNMNQAIVRFRTIDYIEPRYFYYCLLYPNTLDSVIRNTKGVVGQANISITQSRNLIIPVPSRQEQQEIVRILDDLFAKEQNAKELCDLIDQIEAIKKTILGQAFRGELGTNDAGEASAEEILKNILQ